jgi:hypothetical protein
MALITDPDYLGQGASTAVSDMVFASTSGSSTTISSSGNHLPPLSLSEYFEVREHSVVDNNGLYVVNIVNSSTGSYTCTKMSGDLPANASSEPAKTLGANTTPTGTSSTQKTVFFDTGLKKIWLIEQGNLSSDGVTLQSIYSFIKEEWKADSTLIPYAFPMVAITPEQFEFIGGWEPSDDLTRKLIRTGGWKEYDTNDISVREWTGIVTLGTFEDSANDQAYYQLGNDPTDTQAAILFTYKGPVNEPIKVFEETVGPNASLAFTTNTITRSTGSWIDSEYLERSYRIGSKVSIRAAENVGNIGSFLITDVTSSTITVSGTPFTANADDDTAVVAFDHRSAIKLFLRMRDSDANGKTYAQSKLSDIGVTTVDNKVFRFPLTNATDLKISETDVAIAADSPYTAINVQYFDGAFTRDVDSGVGRDFGIVIGVGTFSGIDGSATSSGDTLTSANGGITSTYNAGVLTIHEGDAAGTYTIGVAGGSGGTTVTITGSTFPGNASNASFTLQRSSVVVATAEEIYEKVQYLLRQDQDIDATDGTVTGKTADALLTFVGDTLKAGVSIPTNPNGGGSGVIIEGFRQADTNRLVFYDNSGADRSYPFVAGGTITFNTNLTTDGDGYYWMFYQYTERFTNTGFAITGASGSTATISSATTNLTTELSDGDYIALSGFVADENNGIWLLTASPSGGGPYTVAATKVDGATVVNENDPPAVTVSLDKNPINSPDAIIVKDASASPADISGAISGATVSFSYDYDGNVQGERTPGAGNDAVIVIRAIGLDTAQFVETTGTITRATGLSFSVVSGLERNYST